MKPKSSLFFLSAFLLLGVFFGGCQSGKHKQECEMKLDSLQQVHHSEISSLEEEIDSLKGQLTSANMISQSKIDSLLGELNKPKSTHRIPRPEGEPIRIPKVN